MKKKEFTEESYIYFARRFSLSDKTLNNYKERLSEQGYDEKDISRWVENHREIKIGETASYKRREDKLYYESHINITRRVKFEGTKDERLYVEGYVRMAFAANSNMHHFGNDYFACNNSNTIKGAENKFFQYVTEAFEIMSKRKKKNYNFICEIVHNW